MNDPGLDEHLQETFQNAQHHAEQCDKKDDGGVRAAFRKELKQDDEEEEVGYFQPNRWWFTSTAFPIVAGTFGPLANFFSVCAQSQNWRQHTADGSQISDPEWLTAVTGLSLAMSLFANIVLLANFGHLLRYSIAQPLTIVFWFISAVLLIVPLGIVRTTPGLEHSQAYYYAIIAASVYVILPILLTANAAGAYVFRAYPPSFNALTVPQRTLMLQTTIYVCYLAAGAGVFAHVEGWDYLDGVYWADYTLLTIGLGSDFPPKTHTGRALLIPYAVGGITMLGLLIGSIRGLVLERGKVKVVRRMVARERERWMSRMQEPDEGWKKDEWEAMRRIQATAETRHKYTALGISLFAYLLLWFLGALTFWYSEAPQGWTYFESLYFSYTSLLTVGYGDFFPMSTAGKPFFVVWSIIAVPTVTILISNVGDILTGWIRHGLVLGITGNSGGAFQRKGASGQQDIDQGALNRIGTDVERLGHAVEHVEEKRGEGSGLAARLARQISRLAKDAATKPAVEYAWEDWEAWLALLGELTEGQNRSGSESGGAEDNEKRGEWTWLGEDGPLLSGVSEAQWLLGKLCKRLEEVLEEEYGGGSR
ncbi:hypothetical protein FB45DRAFT_944238 [Roridomyces roridus]|uniref:Potassium channel domain-containing protein n=1 Tax=Roridomyces roridus TaxID=1738132 RepID=A0AAD7F8Z5_9AGAR|nr:hypothetical protein FB45DRAFT_944238 [Roridomyces roridus]